MLHYLEGVAISFAVAQGLRLFVGYFFDGPNSRNRL